MAAWLQKTGGWLLILTGCVLIVMPVLVLLSGDRHYAVLVVAMFGPGLIGWGRLILRRPAPSLHPAAASGAPAGQNPVETLTLPDGLGQAIAAAIRHETAVIGKRLAVVAAIVDLVLLLIFAGGFFDRELFLLLASLITLTMAAAGAFDALTRSWRLGPDLRAGQFVRISGPLRVMEHPMGMGACVMLPDRWFSVGGIRGPQLYRAARQLEWGSVDFLPRSKIILCIRDRQGAVLYRLTDKPGPAPRGAP